VFDAKNGTITAGNSSGITDGAAFVHLSNQKSSHMMAEILDYETVALDPKRMGLGPISAVQNLLRRQNLKMSDIEVIEINEAFAAQALACQSALSIPSEKLNPRGGAIALGHPIGASGARIVVTLLHQLKEKPGALGIATLCVSGGQGVAVLVKSLGN
jgi:acetyl-CoA acetyltransferase family protein